MGIIYEPAITTHWRNLFPNKSMLLGSHNLNEGEELVATITDVSLEKIKNQSGGEETVPVLKFENAPPMVLNVTNTKTIASLYGELYEGWKGESIQLYATEVKAFGEVVKALRVREARPDTAIDLTEYENQLRGCGDMDSLKQVFMGLPKHIKPRMVSLKDEIKEKIDAGN